MPTEYIRKENLIAAFEVAIATLSRIEIEVYNYSSDSIMLQNWKESLELLKQDKLTIKY